MMLLAKSTAGLQLVGICLHSWPNLPTEQPMHHPKLCPPHLHGRAGLEHRAQRCQLRHALEHVCGVGRGKGARERDQEVR